MSAPVTVPRTAIPRMALPRAAVARTAVVALFCFWALACRGAARASAATATSAPCASARPARRIIDGAPIRTADEPRRWAVTGRKSKGPRGAGPSSCRYRAGSGGLGHVCGLWALLALNDLELDAVAFLEGLEPTALDGAVVDEYIRATLMRDEAVALRVVEPLHGPSDACHVAYLLLNRPLPDPAGQDASRVRPSQRDRHDDTAAVRTTSARSGHGDAGQDLCKSPDTASKSRAGVIP